MFDWDSMKNKIILADNKDVMKDIPDKYFELAIVDPPYGIGNWCPSNISKNGKKSSKPVKWNDNIPDNKYFVELERISKNRIIWGANYYNCFENGNGAVIWYKGKLNPLFSQCEIASLFFQKKVDYVHINWQSGFFRSNIEQIIHECQKPVALYRWLLQNYAKPNDKIIDTHSGSGSLACACHLEKYDFLAIEKDEDYYKSSCDRLEILRSQGTLF